MLRKRPWLLLLLALALRLLAQGWDAGSSSSTLHPDERQIAFVTERLTGWLDDPGFYAYGSLHFQAARATATVTGLDDGLRELTLAARLVSLLASMLALSLGWLLARHAWGRWTAGLVLLLGALVPLGLQQAHFATVEAHHAAWVMAALAACYWLATGSRRGAAAALAGAAVGASLAVKVASLPLALPLALALALAARRDRRELARLAATSATAVVAAFWLGQPWAFTAARPPLLLLGGLLAAALALRLAPAAGGARAHAASAVAVAGALAAIVGAAALAGLGPGSGLNPAYLRGVAEQVAMVVGTADLPYVRVYAPTIAILYPLRELALWGWGPALVLAAGAGGAVGLRHLAGRWRRWLAGRWDRSSILLLLLLAWALPMALRLATLEVKYLRYWEPLTVPAVLLAGWWLARLRGRLRRPAVALAVAGTALWGLAYLWAFAEPHPHRTAARWLAPLLAEGQAVAFESWDETLPLEAAGGRIEHLTLPSYDLPDDEAKAARWVAELARADWVVLTSNRVLRTVLANPERFPLTGRLYRLLLAGETGFEPLARVSRGPRVLGLRWPVQRADESFVNYDFPQVLILRRVAPTEVDELLARVRRPLPFLEALDLRGLERHSIAPLPAVPPLPSATRQLFDLGIWLVVFAGVTAAAWVLLLPLLERLPDAGLGLAATSGWLLLAWLMWLGSELALWPTGAATASWLFLALLAGAAVVARRRRRALAELVAARGGAMLKVLSLALGVGALFLAARAGNPAIYWGEKPMDFAFLNAFLDAPVWPPGEPWMAGMPLHYYYFGEVLAAVPILIAGCSAGVGYNLIAATIPALGAAVLAGFGLALARRRSWFAALALPLLVLLSGNLAWPWLLEHVRGGSWFDLWWATSRVIPGFAIDEYPLWTALFADLHGHFIALPVLLTTLGWGWLAVCIGRGRWPLAAILCGISAAVAAATNPWDLFLLTGALGLGCLAAARRPLAGLGRLVLAAAVSLIAAAPFVVELLAGIGAGAGGRGLFLTDADFAPAWAVLRHFGLFLVPLAVLALATLGRRWWLVLPTGGLGAIAGLAFSSTAAALALALAAAFACALLLDRQRLDRLGWAMALLGALAVAACERFTLVDRMNTLFKVYNGVWLVLAFALAAALLRSRGRRRKLLLACWLPLQVAAVLNVPLGIAQGWLQPRIASPRPSLDGQAFLAATDPQTAFLVRALQGAARPGEVVAESAGPYYSQHTRIVMHTGQPTVVGWEWHLSQRGQSVQEIGERMADLETLYAGAEPGPRRAVLDRYRVRWVVLADLERERYELSGADPLRGVPGLARVAGDGAAALYLVRSAATVAPAVTPVLKLPAGASFVAVLPDLRAEVVRAIDLDEGGALVLLRDRRLAELDLAGRTTGYLAELPCEAVSAARFRGEPWAVCGDGRLLRLGGRVWTAAGRVAPGSRLAAADGLWAWGPGGLFRRDGEAWREMHAGPVTAAAAAGARIAFSDGRVVRLGGPGAAPRTVAGRLEGVRALAWQGADLVAVADDGLHRSGGALLPWRATLPEIGPVAAAAGHGSRLWLVRSDGLIVAAEETACPSPWEAAPGRPEDRLREPRDLAVAGGGWFAVADTLNHRVLWYGLDGACLDRLGGEGTAAGRFREPSGLAAADDGRLAICDTWNGRLQVLHPDGRIELVGAELFGPRDALWRGDTLLVADTGNRRVLRFAPPEWRQTVVAELAAPVVGLAELGELLAAAVPADGAVVVLDPDSGAVQRRLEVPGWQSREQQEGYLAVLPGGELVASAPATGELWLLDGSGVAPPRLLRGDLPGVTGLALLPDGELLVALTWEHRLIRLRVEP